MAAKNSVVEVKPRNFPSKVEDVNHSDETPIAKNSRPKDVSLLNSLYTLVILAACCLNAALVFSIPRKNSILHPEFWYEILPHTIVSLYFRHSVSHILELFIFTNVPEILRPTHYVKVLLTSTLTYAVPYCVSYIIWTVHLGNNHPLPFNGAFSLLGSLGINVLFFWFLFPKELRYRTELRKQAENFMCFRVWAFFQLIVQELLIFLANSSLQWLLIVLIPLTRNSSIWLAEKIVQRYPETNNEDVRFLVNADLMIMYTSFFTGRISSLSQSTVYGILTVELVLHAASCYQIIKIYKKVEIDDQSTAKETKLLKQNLETQTLVLSEFTEAMVPIAFALTFTILFYGPNAVLINGVGNNYFGEKAIEDVLPFYLSMLQLFAIDLIAMIISGISLNFFCGINLFREFCTFMKKYWIIFLIKLPSIANFFASKDVNFGMDSSKKFLWITNEGRCNLIRNATELLDEEKEMLLSNTSLCGM